MLVLLQIQLFLPMTISDNSPAFPISDNTHDSVIIIQILFLMLLYVKRVNTTVRFNYEYSKAHLDMSMQCNIFKKYTTNPSSKT